LIDAIKKTIAKKTGWKDEIKTPTSMHTPTPSFETPPVIETSPAYVPSPGTVDDYLALGTAENDGSPVYNPRTSEELASDDEVFGGGEYRIGDNVDSPHLEKVSEINHGIQVGATVLLRGQSGGAARRPWSVSHVGDKFATIKALDSQGLSEDQQIRVVNLSEIFPASSVVQSPIHEIHSPYDTHIHQNPYDSMMMPMSGSMMPTPTIVVAPKFFNGNGNDQSTNMGQPQLQPQVMDTAMNGQPTDSLNNLTITDLITGSSSKKNDESTLPTNTNKIISGDIDFSKPLIITKKS